MDEFYSSPAFGAALTVIAFWLGKSFQKHTRFKSLPPIITACVIIICVLLSTGISCATYLRGSEFIAFMLGPATIAFSLPLMYNIEVIKSNFKPLLIGNIAGAIAGILAVLVLSKLFNVSEALMLSMVPKSVTAPIAMGISETVGGIPSITVAMVILTGIFGAFVGHILLRACGINNHLSIGIAMGAAAHAIGANRCLRESELQTAVASVSLIIVAIITAILAPILISII